MSEFVPCECVECPCQRLAPIDSPERMCDECDMENHWDDEDDEW